MQRVEVRHAVDAEHHGLAVDYELLLAVLQRGLHNPWEAGGPVVAVLRDQTRGLALALDRAADNRHIDFPDPVGTDGHRFCYRGQAELDP
jgi:hypothetical protein